MAQDGPDEPKAGQNEVIQEKFPRTPPLLEDKEKERIKKKFPLSTDILANEEEIRVLDEKAGRDSLTGLMNRRKCQEEIRALEDEIAHEHDSGRKRRKHDIDVAKIDEPISIIFIDIDKFKGYNERYGHTKADLVLRAVAQCISSHVRAPSIGRKGDIVARWGGEEFLVVAILSNGGAKILAEKLRKLVSELTLTIDGELVHPTISVGIGSYHKNTAESIEEAGLAMKHSKKNGRNRVSEWSRELNVPQLLSKKTGGYGKKNQAIWKFLTGFVDKLRKQPKNMPPEN